MTIGIDIDDTITDSSSLFVKLAKKYNKDKKINYNIDLTEWNQEKAFGWNLDNQKEFKELYLVSIFKGAKPKSKVAKIIHKLKEEGYKIIIISSRSKTKTIKDITLNWLYKNKIEYDKIILGSTDKSQDVLKNKVDVFIDDNWEVVNQISKERKIPVFLFKANYNMKYNGSMIEKVDNWKDIYIKIKDIGGYK